MERKVLLPILFDALVALSAAIGVISILAHWNFMVDVERLTDAPFLATFTGLSNIAVGIVALICLLFRLLKRPRSLPTPLFILKLCFSSLILITFLITATYLLPSTGSQWWRLYVNGSFFNHFLTPVLAILTFVLIEPKSELKFRICLFTMIPMACYEIFYMVRAYTHVDPSGKIDLYYDIYGFARWGLFATIGLMFAFLATCVVFSALLLWLNGLKRDR